MTIQSITPQGLLQSRCLLHYQRMQQPPYTPDRVFQKKSYAWYGDWEGRAILALAHASLSTGEKADHLNEIITKLPAHFNANGYIGPVYDHTLRDEQQLAGHSWLLRGLLAYTKMTQDSAVQGYIQTIVQNLLLPTKGFYKNYPVNCSERALQGEAMGHSTQKIKNGWILSTDVGCAFILLDGATDVYATYGGTQLQALIEEMIFRFLEIDVVKEQFQTHATLTALRGILRYMKTTGNFCYLDAVKARMQIYIDTAMTENYQNYNWFGIPKATEPCAVTDSFMVALQLWEITEQSAWLDLAENIFYNGFLASQRENGGFGCDVCSGAEPAYIYYQPINYEAFWCCSMRGAEGLLTALQSSFKLKNSDIILPLYHSFNAKIAQHPLTDMQHTTQYPYCGEGEILVQAVQPFSGKFHLYMPKSAQNFHIFINDHPVAFDIRSGFVVVSFSIEKCLRLRYHFDLECKQQQALRYPGYTNRQGVLILGTSKDTHKALPICDSLFSNDDCEKPVQHQILYPYK